MLYEVITSSPERLVQVQGRTVQTRPIEGERGSSHPRFPFALERGLGVLHAEDGEAGHVDIV